MQTFRFTLLCRETELTEEQVSKLWMLAPDCTAGMSCGRVEIHFDREATFEESTIHGAVEQVQEVGLTPYEVKRE